MRGWKGWGSRFRELCREKSLSTADVAERMDLAESTVRSWLNGTRSLNLSDFFQLCDAAGIQPAIVLFDDVGKCLTAWAIAEGPERGSLELIVEAILERHKQAKRRGAV